KIFVSNNIRDPDAVIPNTANCEASAPGDVRARLGRRALSGVSSALRKAGGAFTRPKGGRAGRDRRVDDRRLWPDLRIVHDAGASRPGAAQDPGELRRWSVPAPREHMGVSLPSGRLSSGFLDRL